MKAKLPAEFEVVLRSVPVEVSCKVISASVMTAPLESRTVPLIAADESCAAAVDEFSDIADPSKSAKKRKRLTGTREVKLKRYPCMSSDLCLEFDPLLDKP